MVVRGILCRIVRVLPAGTVDVVSMRTPHYNASGSLVGWTDGGKAFRVSGLSF
jgi:hypothetical protein